MKTLASRVSFFSAFALSALSAHAAPLTASLSTPPPAESGYFAMGAAQSPDRHTLTVDSRSLRLDGQAWLPVMGEFHYARYPAEEWREELLKMKAGGIDIVATYVFWIHHEEVQGQWDWSGQRNLRQFVETARDVGLDVIVRCGPWCHGEVRNGGIPDWAAERKDWNLRSTDPKFLEAARELYVQIAKQLEGLLWKQGGPVVGVQVDNEYGGPAEYLLALKKIAREVGLDVPIYTRTGWPALKTPMPLGEILPLYGVYAEGFWDRELTSMPGRYWAGFQFSALRSDAAIATDLLGKRDAKDSETVAKYPYLTCEIGGGMMNSYHRRILIDPKDVEATTLVKIASGSTLPGYYMYHGGTNPDGRRTTLMEAQDTLMTNWNDMPVKNYDFQAPLGEFGEVRPHYHLLRRLHQFLDEWGTDLTRMSLSLPDVRPTGRNDVTTLRWAVRSDGNHGFVFVNNYERGRELPAKSGVQFELALADGSKVTFPTQAITVPANAIAWWPFNLGLGGNVTLISATAQPFSQVTEANGIRTVFFAETPGVPAEFVFDRASVQRLDASGRVIEDGSRLVVRDLRPGRGAAIRLLGKSGDVIQCVLLGDEDSRSLWKGPFAGRQRVILAAGSLVFDRDAVRLSDAQSVSIMPAPQEFRVDGKALDSAEEGLFRRYDLHGYASLSYTPLTFELVRPAGPLRQIKLGAQKAAVEPSDADFAAAAVWRVKLPGRINVARRPLVRFDYVGDVARVQIGDKLLTDDFYNGRARDVGLWRYASQLNSGEFRFVLLPLQKNAPIFMDDSVRPTFDDAPAYGQLRSVVLIEQPTVTITAKAEAEPALPANFRTDTSFKR
jgi:hypothetical protein